MKKKRFGEAGSVLTFSERVVQIALLIPKGQVTTYGRIAKAAGGGGMSAQSITGILGKAYQAGEKKIPFHRIVYANGRAWLDPLYREERLKKYRLEGIRLDDKDRVIDFTEKLFLAEY